MNILDVEVFAGYYQGLIPLVYISESMFARSLDTTLIETIVTIGLLKWVNSVRLLCELAKFTLTRSCVWLV